ncbi:MAG TPA: glycosyltransferase family 1 protein [bacterium]|nr:glycosyltransferase family 1 protein [bacterium]
MESSTSRPVSRGAGIRIGIDGTCLALQRGYGRFLSELIVPLLETDRDNEYTLFVDRYAARALPKLPVRIVEARTSASQVTRASARGNRSLRDIWTMSRMVSRESLDIMYFPSVFSWFPVSGTMKVAVAFHDTIAERYAKIVFPTWKTRTFWKLKVRWALQQSNGIVTVSDWSKRSLADWFKLPPERIFVTPEAPAAEFRPADDAEPRRRWLRTRGLNPDAPYLIYVGGFNPHKNLGALIDAFAAASATEDGAGLGLILVGDFAGDTFHGEVRGLRARIASKGLADRAHFAGFVPDADLRHLYAGATALAIPSFEEGFGLPAVEAAACGTPCIATRNSPLPEVLEGGGLFVDPGKPEELNDAVKRIVTDGELRRRLAAGARDRAGRLSWRTTAEATRHALETIARK